MVIVNKKDKGLLSKLIIYLQNPSYQIAQQENSRQKIVNIFKLWSLVISLVIIVGLIVFKIAEYANLDLTENSLIYNFFNQPWYIIIFFILIWAPITEELTFRMGLKFSYYKLGFTIAFFAFIIFDIIFRIFDDFFNTFFEWLININRLGGFIFYLCFIIVLGILISNILKKKYQFQKVEKIYKKHFRLIFYLSAILFALIHFFNYYNLGEIWFLLIPLVAPQFLLGLILGFIRMNYGLGWSMIGHLLHNSIIVSPILLIDSLPQDFIDAIINQNKTRLERMTDYEAEVVLLIFTFLIIIALTIITSLINMIKEYIKLRR